MNFFCKKLKMRVCQECGVWFAPREDNWRHLCKPHATEHLKRDERYNAVKYWFDQHWEEFEEKAKAEQVKNLKNHSEWQQSQIAAMAAMRNQGYTGSVDDGMFGSLGDGMFGSVGDGMFGSLSEPMR
jgi:hypothetical protein